MSNLFTYEIDERNLRVQLKNIEVPMKEEAWHKFETYLISHPPVQPKTGFRGININLSRNVVLPAVFGIIIFLFSFLLFNFVSINDTSAQKVEKQEAVNPPAVAQTQATAPVKQVAEPIVQPKTEPVAQIKTETSIAPQQAPAKEIVSQIPPENNAAVPAQAVSTADPDQPIVHKKRKRKSLEEETLSAIKPSLVSEDENVEIAPE